MTTEYTLQDAARWWLGLGFNLVPIQRGTKYIVKGWGINLRRIITFAEAEKNIIEPGYNMAAVCNGQNFILDFDTFELYTEWAKRADEIYTTSYTETSRRGVHVFLRGEVVEGLRLIDGVEVKRIAVVAPSVVEGYEYGRGFGRIYAGAVDGAFLGLTVPGTPTAYRLRSLALEKVEQIQNTRERKKDNLNKDSLINTDKIKIIKKAFAVERVFSTQSPTKKTLRGSGRWLMACCPFHNDSSPSMWLDTERGTWGCHGCGEHGDVINLYGRLKGLAVGDAIRAMWREVAQ